jgi:hypothetical protein
MVSERAFLVEGIQAKLIKGGIQSSPIRKKHERLAEFESSFLEVKIIASGI